MTGDQEVEGERVNRTFRDLTDEELKDPEVLLALASMGWSRTIDWGELLKSDRVILLSEAGTGKTFECQAQVKRLVASGEAAFFVELVELASKPLDQILSPGQSRLLQDWRDGKPDTAYFFLDSIDEMELSHGKFKAALRNLARVIDGREHFSKVVVTSRPIAVDFEAFHSELPLTPIAERSEPVDPRNQFDAIIRGEARRARIEASNKSKKDETVKPWRTVALMPLSNGQIDQILKINDVADGDALRGHLH